MTDHTQSTVSQQLTTSLPQPDNSLYCETTQDAQRDHNLPPPSRCGFSTNSAGFFSAISTFASPSSSWHSHNHHSRVSYHTSHGSVSVVRMTIKVHGKKANFDPQLTQNPWTDRHQIWMEWLRHGRLPPKNWA